MDMNTLFRKRLVSAFDFVEYGYDLSGGEKTFYIPQDKVTDLSLELTCLFLKILEERFPEHIKIVNIYDFVNEEHWLNPPPPENPTPRPIAEVTLLSTLEDFKSAINNSAPNEPTSLEGVTYNPETCTFTLKNKTVKLPFNTLQSRLAALMFTLELGVWTDWSVIDELLNGEKDSLTAEDKRSIRDTARAINTKLQAGFLTSDELIARENHGIQRNF